MNPKAQLLSPLEEFLPSSNYFYVVKLDLNGVIIFANSKFQNQLAVFNEEVEGSRFSKFIFPSDYSKYQNLLEKTQFLNERNFVLDIRKMRHDGFDFYWTRWEFSIHYINGKPEFVIGLGHKIEKFSDINIDLPVGIHDIHIKNEIIEGLFENNLIGFWLWDILKNHDQLSISLMSLLGYIHKGKKVKKEQIKWKKNIHPDDLKIVNDNLEEHFNSFGKVPFHCEFRMILSDNNEKWVIGYGKVVEWSPKGKPSKMVGGFFDATGKKKSENLLKMQHELLKNLNFNQSHTMRAKLANIIGILEVIDPKMNLSDSQHFIKMLKSEAKKLDQALKKSIANTNSLDLNLSNQTELTP
ncbi:PAS domain-containing protein [Shivajiella indica]|uniref:histidine kinase n=1 Tax=Shivajiella indica TaxID=872115 RepID=A0ABW5BA22_9BACT